LKRTITIMVAVLLIAGALLASAAEGKGWFQKGKKETYKPSMGLCPMHMMACQSMMEKKMVALEDGSIIIMTCGKLYKYDKDLNFVKDVELTNIKNDAKAKLEEIKKECAEKCGMKMKVKTSETEKSEQM
jgi:hypothetical protein